MQWTKKAATYELRQRYPNTSATLEKFDTNAVFSTDERFIKVGPSPTSYDRFEKSLAVSKLLLANQIPTPEAMDLHKNQSGASMLSFEKIIGATPSSGKDVGAILRSIHGVSGVDFECQREYQRRCFNNRKCALSESRYKDMFDESQESLSSLIKTMETGNCLIHGDPNVGNFISNTKPYVIDLETAMAGTEAYDLAKVKIDTEIFVEVGRWEEFIKEYQPSKRILEEINLYEKMHKIGTMIWMFNMSSLSDIGSRELEGRFSSIFRNKDFKWTRKY